MPTIISGARATAASQGILAARRVVDMADSIFLLEPDKAPLTLFSSMVSRESVHNPEYDCLEDERIPTIDRVNNSGGYTAGATSVVVDNGGYFPVNSFVRVQRTGEVLHVTAVSTNTLTVVRSWGGTAAAALVDNDQLSILAGGAAENATSETSKTTKAAKVTNYTQIVRWPFDVTGTLQASELYGASNELSYQQRKASLEWAVRAEQAFLWGEKNEDTSGSQPRRTTGGIDEFISTNSRDFGGSFNLVTFWDFMKDGMRYGDKTKLLLASRGLTHNITLEAMQYVEKVEKDVSFGMDISQLVIPAGGRLNIKTHDLMEGDQYGAYGLGVSLSNVGYRFLRGRDVKLNTNIQANDLDGRKDEYLGEIGFFRSLEKNHFRIKNAA